MKRNPLQRACTWLGSRLLLAGGRAGVGEGPADPLALPAESRLPRPEAEKPAAVGRPAVPVPARRAVPSVPEVRARLPAPLVTRAESQQLDRICRDILALHPQLNVQRQAMGRFGADIENEFVLLGRTLRQISQQLPEIGHCADQLEDIIFNRDEEQAFAFAYQLSKKSGDLVNASLEFSDSISVELDYFASQVQAIRRQRDKIEGAFFVFNILKLNFRMKAVRLENDKEANFLDVANKIESIYQQLETLIETEFNKIVDIYHFIRKSQKDFATNRAKQSQAIDYSKRIIQRNLRQIQDSLGPAAEFARQIEQVAQQTQSRVNAVIVGLQYQDIVKQKLEAVSHSFNAMIEQASAGVLSGQDPMQKRKACAYMHHSALEQMEQLRLAREELRRAGEQILQGIRELLQAGINLIGQTKRLALESMVDARMIESFVRELRNLNSVLNASSRINYSIPPLVERIGQTMETFSQDIMRLSRIVRLVALNSQAMSVSLPTGHAMGELSSQTRATADSTLQISQSLSKQLRDILPEINQVKNRFERFMNIAEQDQERLNVECQISSDKLAAMHQRLAQQFETVEQRFHAVNEDAQTLLSRITFPQLAEERLGQAEMICERLLRLTAPYATEDDLRRIQDMRLGHYAAPATRRTRAPFRVPQQAPAAKPAPADIELFD